MFVEKYFKNIKWKNTFITSNQQFSTLLRCSVFPHVVIFKNYSQIHLNFKFKNQFYNTTKNDVKQFCRLNKKCYSISTAFYEGK